MAWFDLKKAIVKIKDGSTHSIDVKVGEGTLNYTERKPRQYLRDRGLLSDIRDGDEEPVDVTIDCIWEFITGDADVTIEDALKQRNVASAWESTDSDLCNPYAVDLIIDYHPCASSKGELITLSDFRYEQIAHDAKAGTLNVTGKCNITEAAVERTTSST